MQVKYVSQSGVKFMEDKVIVIAERKAGRNSIKSSGYGVLTSLLIFIIDLIFFLTRRALWNQIILIVSSVFLGLGLIFLLFSYSTYKTNKKKAGVPLLTYDKSDMTFGFVDIYANEDKKFSRDIVQGVEINGENDEAQLVYLKGEKEKTIFIGYSYKGSEETINNKIKEIKNL